ncbi:MAG TPA: YbaB/EbfC family nucleoid-associated protein [Micromonosporaceae bacterium]
MAEEPVNEQWRTERDRLARAEVMARSADGRVRVKATSGARVTALRLDDGVLRRYDTGALSDLITRTVRDAQMRAHDTYVEALEQLDPATGQPRR